MQLHYIELNKFKDDKEVENMTELEEWITFIKNSGMIESVDKVKKIAARK